MTSKFKRPAPRFDNDQAKNGIWCYIEDENGYEYGGFKVSLLDGTIPSVRVAIEAQERRAKNHKKSGDKIRDFATWWIELFLHDWDMTGEDGKAIKFSKKEAVDFFMESEIDPETGKEVYIQDYAFARLLEFSRDVRNFQSDEQNAAGDPAGN